MGVFMSHEYLSVGDVAQRSGFAASAIRFYEARGLIHAERTDGNQRLFHRDVLRRLACLRIAQRVGLSLAEIEESFGTLPVDRAPTAQDWRRMTRGWREQIDERIRLLDALREGLTSCIGCGCLSLRTCALANPDDVAANRGSGPQYLIAHET